MSSEESQAILENKKQDEEVRQFKCPCGKSYLSYPALYTHVKIKHDGRAPGELTKPITERSRGRSKKPIADAPLQDSQCPFDLKEQILKVLNNISIDYEQNFQIKEGDTTCQDMASKFYIQLDTLNQEQLKIIKCFLNQLKYFIDLKFGQHYWNQNDPAQIVNIANQFYHSHDLINEIFPLQKNLLIELTFILFKWMYENKWTSHKLLKRSNSPSRTKAK